MWREWDGDGVAVGEVLSLELLLLNHTKITITVMLHFDLKHSRQYKTNKWERKTERRTEERER